MKNTKYARAVKSLLWFLAINLLLLTMPLSSKGQRQSVTPSLFGTGWKAATKISMKPSILPLGSTLNMQFVYEFVENGKVRATIFSQQYGYRSKLKYNPLTNREDKEELEYELLSAVEFNEVGRYKQNVNSIYLEFADHSIDATIKGNGMEGVITLKGSNEKAKWVAVKLSDGVTNTSSASPVRNPSPPNSRWSKAKKLENTKDLATFVESLRLSARDDLISESEFQFRPAKGYRWLKPDDPNDFDVGLMPGLIKSENGLHPAKGYRWVQSKDPEDLRVEPVP